MVIMMTMIWMMMMRLKLVILFDRQINTYLSFHPATISTSNLVNNITSRIVKSEIRTSIVSISSSRIDLKRDGASVMSLSTLSVNSADTSVSDKSSSQVTTPNSHIVKS